MILNHQQIVDAVNAGSVLIDPYDSECVEAASYDLRMGKQAITTTERFIIDVSKNGFFVINPGDFAVVVVHEKLKMDNCHTGRFGLKSKYSRKGIIASTGPQIDPGYDGRLIVGMTNLSPNPISIPYKTKLFTAEFHRLEQESDASYSGPYQGRYEIGGEEIEGIIKSTSMSLSEMYTTLQSLSLNVAKLSKEVRILTWLIPILLSVIALIVAFKP